MDYSTFVENAIRQYSPLLAAHSATAVERAVTLAMEGHSILLQSMCSKINLPYPATLGVLWAIGCGNFDRMTPNERLRDYQAALAALAQYDATNLDNNLACTAR
jgi:hypothetical protein